jgi:hypothetical protein
VLAKRLVDAALELHGKQLWRKFAEDDALVLEIPGRDAPMAACFCGQYGQEFGFALFPEGLAGLDRFFAGGESDELVLLVSPLREVPPPLRGLLEEARWRGRRDAPAPHLIVKRAGRQPRNPRKGEIRTVLYAAAAILSAHDELEPRHYASPDGVPLLRLSGKPHAPSYELDTAVFERAVEKRAPLSLPPASRHVVGGAWSIGLMELGGLVEGDDRSTKLLLVVDRETGDIAHHDILMGYDPDRVAALVADYAGGSTELPAEALFLDRELLERLEPAFAEYGVACRHDPEQPILHRIAEGLFQSFLSPDESPEFVAAAARYRQCHDAFVDAMAETAERHGGDPDRALARYFGSARRGRKLIEAAEHAEYYLFPFMVWRFGLYRARKNSPTVLERTLKRRDLPPEVRAVGEAMRGARPSLYRIESLDPPRLELLDVAGGKTVTVRDVGLSNSARPGLLLPGIVYPAVGYLTISIVGPALPGARAAEAFEFLESEGIPVTPEGLAANPHFGGRLAEWLERQPAFRPALRNTDGDPMVLHTAEFVAEDPRAAAAALDANSALDFDDENGSYVWHGGEHPTGGELILGRIELIDDRLLLECNSERRFDRGRAMLEQIPGVRFESVRARPMDVDALAKDLPRDDLPGIGELGEPDEPDLNDNPEVVAHIATLMEGHLMRWLDTEIPMFGGKTPREMCATEDGRRRVRLEIRTMPTPHPSMEGEPMQRLRARMLEELGLDR